MFRVDVNKVLNCSSSSSDEFSSFARNFLSSTEFSGNEPSAGEVRQRADPQLVKPIAGPHLSSVLSSWGEGARDKLASLIERKI